MNLLRYLVPGSDVAPGNINEEFRFLIANYRQCVPVHRPPVGSPKPTEELFHQYCDFSLDEIIFKIFCSVHNDDALADQEQLLGIDSDLLDERARATVMHCFRNWLSFQAEYFQKVALLESMIESTRNSRSELAKSKAFYQTYHIERARNYTKRTNLKAALGFLEELQTVADWKLLAKIGREVAEDTPTSDLKDQVAEWTAAYVEGRAGIEKLAHKKWSTELKDRMRKKIDGFLREFGVRFVHFFQRIVERRSLGCLREWGLTDFFEAQRALSGPKDSLLWGFDLSKCLENALMNHTKTLTERIGAEATKDTGDELIRNAFQELGELHQTFREAEMLGGVEGGFEGCFSQLLESANSLASKGFISITAVGNIKEVLGGIYQDGEVMDGFCRFVQEFWQKSVVQKMYAIVLDFDKMDLTLIGTKSEFLGGHPSLRDDPDFTDHLASLRSTEAVPTQAVFQDLVVYNELTLSLLNAFIVCSQDFKALHRFCPTLKRVPRIEDFSTALLTFVETQKLEGDLSVKPNLLPDPTYFAHKIATLSGYRLAYYSDFLVRKEHMRRTAKTHLPPGEHLPEFESIQKEAKGIKKRLNELIYGPPQPNRNFYLTLKTKLDQVYLIHNVLEFQNVLRDYLAVHLPDFQLEKESDFSRELLWLVLEDLFPVSRFEDFLDSLTSTLVPATDSDQFFGLLFDRLMGELKALVGFMEFAFRQNYEAVFWGHLLQFLVRMFMADVFHFIVDPNLEVQSGLKVNALHKLIQKLPKSLDCLPSILTDELGQFLQKLIGFVEASEAKPDTPIDIPAALSALEPLKYWINVSPGVSFIAKRLLGRPTPTAASPAALDASWETFVRTLLELRTLKI